MSNAFGPPIGPMRPLRPGGRDPRKPEIERLRGRQAPRPRRTHQRVHRLEVALSFRDSLGKHERTRRIVLHRAARKPAARGDFRCPQRPLSISAASPHRSPTPAHLRTEKYHSGSMASHTGSPEGPFGDSGSEAKSLIP